MTYRQNEPEWRSIPDNPAYQVSSHGDIRRVTPGRGASVRKGGEPRHLKPVQGKRGYLRVRIWCDRKKKNFYISRLVLTAFVGEPFAGAQAAHRNGINTDNRLENLYWATHKENVADKVMHGTVAAGENHARSKLTDDSVRAIRASSESLSKLAATFGVCKTTVQKVRNSKAWTHVV